jgi:hypothetical protein
MLSSRKIYKMQQLAIEQANVQTAETDDAKVYPIGDWYRKRQLIKCGALVLQEFCKHLASTPSHHGTIDGNFFKTVAAQHPECNGLQVYEMIDAFKRQVESYFGLLTSAPLALWPGPSSDTLHWKLFAPGPKYSSC